MSLQICLPIVAILLLVVYVLLNRPQKIIVADAGPTRELTAKEQRKNDSYAHYSTIKLQPDKTLQTRDYIMVKVDGKCMEPRGIKDKCIVYVKPLDKNIYFKKQVKLEDVLLIYLHDKGVYKLRILQNYDNEKQLITYRYMNNGEKHISSRTHNPNDVVGVVKYIKE